MENYVGEIRIFAGNYAPENWLFCEGQELPIAEYDMLFALIGTTYGGDGQTTFRLPDLRGRLPLHQGTNPQTGASYRLGQAGGTETVTLRPEELPAHTHVPAASSQPGNRQDPSDVVWAGGAQQYAAATPNQNMNPTCIDPVGGNAPHDNMMPYLPLSYIIATAGLWPSQN